MSYSPGDLVGIPLPYSDLKTEKRRPVLVMTHEDRHGDFICASVTSVPMPEFAEAIDNASMSTGELPRRSWVRCDEAFYPKRINHSKALREPYKRSLQYGERKDLRLSWVQMM